MFQVWKNWPYVKPVCKFSSTSASGKGTTQNIQRGNRRIMRIYSTSKQLPTIRMRRTGGAEFKLLVDSGAGINVLRKGSILRDGRIKTTKETEEQNFSIGHAKFKSSESVTFKICNELVKFYVVDDNFPLIEDGIFGLPAMKKFKFNITNNYLQLNDKRFDFQDTEETIEPNTQIHKTVYLEGKPTRVCFVNCGRP
ncbi:unnamed protein product [Xylocopa violacea]|uniref:Peptidase A2 domain-containing protein n=1 Tax=Xylocopa violacea TaxID=135666 RepID=A0ABP1MX79_XYLVO